MTSHWPLAACEACSVTAESPIIDTKQAARQTNIRDEQIALIPHGRDFTSLVTQAPGANNEAKLGGLSIDGASAGENRFIVDGIETTNLQSGLSGKNLIVDFVDEVQVKSSGYTAEYGGAMGGVISAVTKSGTNAYHGTALLNFEGSGGEDVDAGRARQRADAPHLADRLEQAEYITYPEDSRNRVEPGFALGGPIAEGQGVVLRRVSAGADQLRRAHVDASTAQNPKATASDRSQKQQVQYITANQTSQISNNIRTACRVQQQLEQAGRPAARAERPRPGGHELHEGHDVPELGALRRHRTGCSRRSSSSASAAATARRISTTST